MPDFSFNPDGHIYKLDGKIISSVTQCLPYNYHRNNTEAMQKGQYVHDMSRLYLLNDLDEETLDPILVPYLDALKKFLHDSKGMGIEGVFDIKSGSPHPCVELQIPAYIELANNGIPMETLDLIEYELLLEMPHYHPIHRYSGTPDIIMGGKPVKEGHALYLKDNGKYSLSTVKDIRINLETFLCFLRAEKWKKAKGLNNENS
jgi:hypothetical protein